MDLSSSRISHFFLLSPLLLNFILKVDVAGEMYLSNLEILFKEVVSTAEEVERLDSESAELPRLNIRKFS